MTTARNHNGVFLAIILFGLLALFPDGAQAQTTDEHWTGGSAHTLPAGRFERGIFLPLRWGITDNVEVSAFPLAEFAIPNLKAKIRWTDRPDATVSTTLALAYPTPLLNLLARSGTGGVLPALSKAPPMLSIHAGVLMTRPLGKGHALTTSMTLTTTPRFNQNGDFPTIDLPVVYPRTASYHAVATGRGAMDLRGPVSDHFGYRATLDAFFLPGAGAFEQSGRLAWTPGSKFRLMAGYLLTWGHYPFGRQWNAFPVFDAQFAW